jgi:hypothetical protein
MQREEQIEATHAAAIDFKSFAWLGPRRGLRGEPEMLCETSAASIEQSLAAVDKKRAKRLLVGGQGD